MAKYTTVHQYEPLVAPSHWKEEEKRLVQRITAIFDDIYRRYGRLGLEDISTAFEETLGLIRKKANEAYELAQSAGVKAMDAQAFGRDALREAENARLPVNGVVFSVSAVCPVSYGLWELIGSGDLFSSGTTVYAFKRTA